MSRGRNEDWILGMYKDDRRLSGRESRINETIEKSQNAAGGGMESYGQPVKSGNRLDVGLKVDTFNKMDQN